MFGRSKVAMLVAEFLGTFSLASAILAMARFTAFPFFAAAAAGGTLALMVLVIGATSGAHINPAVTVGMWSLRKIETTRAIVYIAVQLLGGLVAWRLNEYLMNSPLKNTAASKLDWRVFIAEAVGTFIFTFGIAAAVYQGYRGLRQAAAIGGSLALGILIASFGSNGLLNPAVAIGVRSISFAYLAAPVLGAVVGMNVYALLFAGQPVVAASASARTAGRTTMRRPAKKSVRKTRR